MLRPGTVFAGFEIVGPLGKGGMGTVYEAIQLTLGRRVALKVVTSDLGEDPEFRRRFKREGRMQANLDHPNVVAVYEASEAEDGTPFIAMRLVRGPDLKQMIRDESLEPERGLRILEQIADALDAAHEEGMVHRDIKPQNILVGARDHAYLADFGLIKGSDEGSGATKSGVMVGTLDYMSPEQIQGDVATAASDIYALTVVLYECVAGCVPFRKTSEAAVMFAHLSEPPPSVVTIRPTLSPALDDVIHRGMAKKPGLRYATAAELIADARAALAGIEPAAGPWVGETITSVPALVGEETLIRPAAAAPPSDEPAPVDRPGRPRRRLWALAGGVLAVVVVAVALVALLGGGGEKSILLPPGSVGAVDVASGRITQALDVGFQLSGVAVGADGSVWVASTSAGLVSRIDPESGKVTQIHVGSEPIAIAIAPGGAVWVANSGDGTVSRISARTNDVVSRIDVGAGPSAVVATSSAVWVANALDASVMKIDPVRGRVVGRYPVGTGPAGLALGGHSLWVTNSGDGTVQRLDPATGEPLRKPIVVGAGPHGIAYGHGAAWVANSIDGTLSRIDGESESVTSIPVGAGPYAVAVGGNRVWVSTQFAQHVIDIDASKMTVARTVATDGAPTGIALSPDRLWVAAVGAGSAAHRGGVLVSAATGIGGPGIPDPVPIDPATAYNGYLWRILIMTSDGLVGFQRDGGIAGGTLVPDLATALPTPTDDGRTYTFRIRPGIRYSTGAPVRASDFRRGLERSFRIGGGPISYFTDLVGGAHCLADPKHCSLSRGVVADDSAGTVTFHMTKPDSDFLYQLTLPAAYPVSRGTPDDTHGRPIPGTGPYRIAFYRPRKPDGKSHGQLVLERNRHFHEWSAAAQPVGFPDRIVINSGYSLAAEAAAVARGRADLAWDPPPADAVPRLRNDRPEQLHFQNIPLTGFVYLNARTPPFSNVDARRAVNYAVDRRALIASAPGSTYDGRVTCQLLPPNFPSYAPYCPYTVNPTASGRYLAPNLDKARDLVRRSKTRGARFTIALNPGSPPSLGRRFASELRAIGYRPRVVSLSPNAYNALYGPGGHPERYGAIFEAWQSDYAAASNFVGVLISCSGGDVVGNVNLGGYCGARLQRQIDRARAAQAQGAGFAAQQWTAIDHSAVDQGVTIPIASSFLPALVSARTGNFKSNPQWGVLVDQLWVR